MEKIALVGPMSSNAKKIMKSLIPDEFEVIEIESESEYDKLHDVNYIVLRTLHLNAETINSIENLKLIQRWGVGYDTVDIKAAGAKNIPVAITTGVNAVPVSELAVLLMLAVYRNLIQLHNNTVEGKWIREEFMSKSYVINGKMVGLIGLGNIGMQVAQKVKAFRASVQYYDLFRLNTGEEEKLGIKYVELDELLKTSDIISLHVPLTDDTKHLICKETIELMKPTALIINTARGEIIKEDDLIEALENNRILGAGLDCFENEPVNKDNPLLKLKNVVFTPHIGGNTADNDANMAERCVENILKVSKGEKLSNRDVVNYQYFIND